MPKLDELALEHLAMQYAINSFDVEDRPKGVFDLKPKMPEAEWNSQHLHYEMCRRFGVYQTQEAIKKAKETLRMVIPDQGDSDA